MSTTAAIKATNLFKEYRGKKDSKVALDHINLEVPSGSIFALLGPNGAGKSTFINILANLVNKSSGYVEICGFDIDQSPKQASSNIGIVPQELVLDPFFTPYESLEYIAGFYGVAKKDRKSKEILEALDLTDKINVRARRLSGGMRRRLLIAKALVHSPKILVLDEPTAGVDVTLRQQLWDYVKKLNKEFGTTILLTTHYLEEAEILCDRVAVINHGKIIANDSKSEIMGLIDRKKLIITPKEPINTIPESLSIYSPIINQDNTIEIDYKQSDVSIAEILNLLQEAKIDICDLSTNEPDLEEVFKYLMQK